MQRVPAKTALYLSTTMMDQHFGYLEDEDLILRHISICEEQMIDKWIDRKIDIERERSHKFMPVHNIPRNNSILVLVST